MESIGEEKENERIAFLDRSSRATRGKRMTKLLDDELEDDEVFWNQDALKEEENDNEYEAEAEAADVFDSDFDEDEPDPDEEAENEPADRAPPKKRLMFPGKTLGKKKKKTKVLSKVTKVSEDVETSENSTPSEHHDAPNDVEVEKVIRKSTRTSVVVKQAERDAIRAALQATARPIKRKKEGEEKRMTQEEMILEAAHTELMNLRNLQRVLAREEEVKKRAAVQKAVYNGPQIRYLSRNGCSYLEYKNGASFESDIMTKAPCHPEKAICVVTGLPAKYRDPKTGLPYATKEAFKIIRDQLSEKICSISEKQSIGPLGEDIQGFSNRRKRTVSRKIGESSYLRPQARFRRFPDSEEEDSE